MNNLQIIILSIVILIMILIYSLISLSAYKLKKKWEQSLRDQGLEPGTLDYYIAVCGPDYRKDVLVDGTYKYTWTGINPLVVVNSGKGNFSYKVPVCDTQLVIICDKDGKVLSIN